VVRLLLQNGANASLPAHASANYTTLLLAQQQQQQQQQLQSGGEVDVTGAVAVSETEPGDMSQSDAPFKEGVTPLMMAARHGHLEVVKLLLEHGATVTAQVRSSKEFQLLHYGFFTAILAAACMCISATQMLLLPLLLLHCTLNGATIIIVAADTVRVVPWRLCYTRLTPVFLCTAADTTNTTNRMQKGVQPYCQQ
jgi:ankyrin repeat protein